MPSWPITNKLFHQVRSIANSVHEAEAEHRRKEQEQKMSARRGDALARAREVAAAYQVLVDRRKELSDQLRKCERALPGLSGQLASAATTDQMRFFGAKAAELQLLISALREQLSASEQQALPLCDELREAVWLAQNEIVLLHETETQRRTAQSLADLEALIDLERLRIAHPASALSLCDLAPYARRVSELDALAGYVGRRYMWRIPLKNFELVAHVEKLEKLHARLVSASGNE